MPKARGRPTSWTYVIRHHSKGGGALAVPAEIARQIPKGSYFTLKVTATGLHYEIVKDAEAPTEPIKLPWGTDGQEVAA